MKINGQQMGIVGCPNLRFRVHPYCRNKIGGLLRSSKEDREALKKCKALNNIKTNRNKSKKIKKRRKKNKWKNKKKRRKSKSKKQRSKFKKRRRKKRKKLKIVHN